MTKDYKSYEQKSGRFNRRQIGDSTLAIRRQSEAITDALKQNQLRYQQVGKEWIQGEKTKESNEKENRRLLKELDNKEYQNVQDAIQVRKQNEVEALEAQAKEMGERSDYWLDWSTTGALNLAKGSKAIADFVQTEKGDRAWEKYRQTDDYKARILALSKLTETEDLKIAIDEGVATLVGSYDDSRELKKIRRMGNNQFSIRMAEDVIANKELYFRKFEDLLNKELPKDYNHRTARMLWDDYAERLIEGLGINKASTGAEKIRELISTQGTVRAIQKKEQADVLAGTLDINDSLKTLIEHSGEIGDFEWDKRFESLMNSKMRAWEAGPNNTIINPKDKNNRHTDGIRGTFGLLLDNGYFDGEDYETKLEALLNHKLWTKDSREILLSGKTNLLQSIRGRFNGIDDDFYEEVTKRRAGLKDKRQKEYAAEGQTIITEMNQKIDSGEHDLSTRKGQDKFFSQYGTHSHPDVKTAANRKLFYNPQTHGTYKVFQNLKQSAAQGDLPGFLNWYTNLDQKTQQNYEPMFKELSTLTEGFQGKDIQKDLDGWAQGLILGKVSKAGGNIGPDSWPKLDPSARDMQGILTSAFNFEFSKIAKDESLSAEQKVRNAKEAVEREFSQDDGIGRVTPASESPNNNVIFNSTYRTPSTDQSWTPDKIRSDFSGASEDATPFKIYGPGGIVLKEGTSDSKESKKSKKETYLREAVSHNELANFVTNVHQGTDNIRYPQNIGVISELTGESKRDIMNKLLVDKGFVPEGTVFIPADTDAIIKKAFEMNGKKFPLKNINQRHYQNLMPILLFGGT